MAELRRSGRRRADDGFTLIEVVVALGIFLVAATALLPQFVSGIRSVAKADREGVTQGILQQQVERLRGLPYRVSLGSDVGGTDQDVDLLDIYFPDLTAPVPDLACESAPGELLIPTTTEGTGYITGTRCAYDPPSGPFYRTVRPTTDPELGTIALVYDLQFVTGGSAASPTPEAATPRAGYDSNHAITNYPPSSQVGVTVTVLYTDRGAVVARSLSTQIAKHDSGATLVRTRAQATAVQVTSMAPSGAMETLTAGVVSLAASVSDISTAEVSLSGVVARVATGDPSTSQLAYGATTTVSAPPSVSTLAPVDVIPDWGTGCTALLCFGRSRVGSDLGGGISTDGGLPSIGAPATPVRSSVVDAGAGALTFDNVGASTSTQTWAGPVVQLSGAAAGAVTDCPGLPGSVDRVSAASYLTTAMHSGSQTVRDTAACAGGHATSFAVLPTDAAPEGIVRVTLNQSYASCSVVDGVGSGSKALTVSVEAWDGTAYQTVDPVAHQPGFYSVGEESLQSYIEGWTLAAGTVTPDGSSVRVEVPGLTITTAPTRRLSGAPDLDSSVVITLGAASCSSESDS
ncbi:type IV pilus modification PilV family protein [Nocardioides sp. T2.26MG-1]|uniref:type IV pilus modification PilV family protein n=1 Tax=Nocardioides sp. T2.26MG-1 TaxID=3041166 RepID=UPI002477AC16|nr:type II secretion system protein [Nocardioides sp. T2.26MG-1]CAI9409698.1 hypothetical protein HIDPHFAB_01340 [Nocardioides sp. T2.26MG-1]